MPAKGKVARGRALIFHLPEVSRLNHFGTIMKILVNNKPEQLAQGNKLAELLLQLGLSEKRGIAVAVNNRVIGRAEWEMCDLNENDKVTIIRPTQGG